MPTRLTGLRKSALYASLVAWRTRAFWLRAFLSFLIGAMFLILDESQNYDMRFTVRGAQAPDSRIVIIDIPEHDWLALQGGASRNSIRTLKEIRHFNDGFFWDANLWQKLLDTILTQDPAAIGVALYFGEHLPISQLTEAQKKLFANPRVVWGADLDSAGRPLIPDLVSTYDANAGIKFLRADDDGIVRRFSSSLVQIPALPIRIAQLVSGRIDHDPEENRWQSPNLINYMGPAETFITLNVRNILEGRVPPEILRDKVIIIGSRTNPVDQLQTPVGRMSRAEIVANITDNILGDKWIHRSSQFVYLIGLAALMIFSIWILSNYPQSVALLLFIWTGTLLAALSAWTFDTFYAWIPILSPALQLGFTYIIFLSYQLSLNEQKTWRLEQERIYLLEIEQLKNNFVSMMSHDLKTPIAKIQGIVDRLLMRASADVVDDLRSLRRSSDDLHRYIQSILQVTRVEAKDFKISKEVIDINEQIEKVIARLAPLAQEKQIRLIQNLEPMFSIEADTTLIQEVILNLIENAVKYTPPGSRVTITSQEKDDNVFVIVEDTGVGIALEDQESVWGKFTRGKNLNPATKGTGLGLYLVKYFIELHGGRVFLESQPGVGTKIGFSIPIATESESA